MVEFALFQLLSQAPAVNVLVGARIYPALMPESPNPGSGYPAISYFKVDDPGEEDLDGPSGLNHPRFQIDAWSNGAQEAVKVAKAALAALDGFTGTVVGLDDSGAAWAVNIDGIIKEDARGPMYEKETRSYHSMVDVMVWYEDAT